VAGVVKWFDADEGWGVIIAPEVPGVTYEEPGFLQDGCPFRALAVWPES
jgi:hypothetical protein